MEEVLINRVYKNYKGDYYIVVDIAINSENLEKMVCYRGLYPQYKQKYKFELQEIESQRK